MKTSQSKPSLLIAVVALLWPLVSQAQTKIHFVGAFDTDDSTSGVSIQKSKQAISVVIKALDEHDQISVHQHWFTGSDFDAAKIRQTLHSFSNLTSNDVIFLYFNSHGYREEGQSDKYPWIEFSQFEGLSLKAEHNRLKRTGARLVLSFADCCNNYSPASYGPRRQNIPAPDALHKLFILAKGDVICASSQPGQYSFALDDGGGIFSQSFKDVFHFMLSNAADNPVNDWKSFLHAVQQKVAYKTNRPGFEQEGGGRGQLPVFDVDVNYDAVSKRRAGGFRVVD